MCVFLYVYIAIIRWKIQWDKESREKWYPSRELKVFQVQRLSTEHRLFSTDGSISNRCVADDEGLSSFFLLQSIKQSHWQHLRRFDLRISFYLITFSNGWFSWEKESQRRSTTNRMSRCKMGVCHISFNWKWLSILSSSTISESMARQCWIMYYSQNKRV